MNLKHSAADALYLPSETTGSVVGKIGVAWMGFFAGISLGDIVLLATLVYTVLNIYVLLRDRIVIPWRVAKARVEHETTPGGL